MKLPDYPAPNSPLLRSWGLDVVNYLRALTPRVSPTVLPKMGPNGTTYAAAAQSPSQPSAVAPLPWAPFGADADGKVSFVPAMINGSFPKIGATGLDADPAPTLTITTTGTVYCKISRSSVTGQPDGTTMVIENAAITPANTESFFYVTIHAVERTVAESVVSLRWSIGRSTSLHVASLVNTLNVWRA
jgi:hypothetical protein